MNSRLVGTNFSQLEQFGEPSSVLPPDWLFPYPQWRPLADLERVDRMLRLQPAYLTFAARAKSGALLEVSNAGQRCRLPKCCFLLERCRHCDVKGTCKGCRTAEKFTFTNRLTRRICDSLTPIQGPLYRVFGKVHWAAKTLEDQSNSASLSL